MEIILIMLNFALQNCTHGRIVRRGKDAKPALIRTLHEDEEVEGYIMVKAFADAWF